MIWNHMLMMYVCLVIVDPLTYLRMGKSPAESANPCSNSRPSSRQRCHWNLPTLPRHLWEWSNQLPLEGQSTFTFRPSTPSPICFHMEWARTSTQKYPQSKLPSDPLRLSIVASILDTEASSICSSAERENCERLRISH